MSESREARAEQFRVLRAKRTALLSVKIDESPAKRVLPKSKRAKKTKATVPAVDSKPTSSSASDVPASPPIALGPGNLFRATDIVAPIRRVIASISVEGVGSAETGISARTVARFVGGGKGLVLKPNNRRALAATFGEDESTWIGRTIAIFQGRSNYLGQPVPALHVRGIREVGEKR